MTVLTAALPPALAGWQAPPDGSELRLLSARLSDAAERFASAARELALRTSPLPGAWTGTAAARALSELDALQQRALSASGAHGEAAHVLLVCAARLDEAAATWRRAEGLERQDAMERAAAGAAAAFAVDAGSLRQQARRLAQFAHAEQRDALARANAQLHELADRAVIPSDPGLTTADQLRGLGRGAVDALWGSVVTVAGLSLPRLLVDPGGWRDAVTGLRDGAAYAIDHPRDAAIAMTGWDQLQAGRYGEWAGSLVPDLLAGAATGGGLPMARRSADLAGDLGDLAEDVDDLQRVHGRGFDANTGGPVVGGPHLPPGYVTRIRDLAPERRRHILDGDPDGRGGGHRHGTGRPCKSEFPDVWSDDEIISRVMQTARNPHTVVWQSDRKTFVARAEHAGVIVTTIVNEHGAVVSGYPKKGPGVRKNPCR